MYDNDRLLSKEIASSAEISDVSALIGPVSIKFDIKSNAKYVSKYMDIDSFDVDFDGDGMIHPEIGEIEGGQDPENAENLVFTYDKKKTYSPKGRYTGTDKLTKEKKTMDIEFPKIVISGLVEIRRNETKKTVAFDASDVIRFGNPKWYESNNMNTVASSEKIYTSKIEANEKYVCLSLEKSGKKNDECDKIFLVSGASSDAITGKIQFKQDTSNPLVYEFEVNDLKIRDGAEIVSYQWMLDNGAVIGQSEALNYTFSEYRKGVKISVKLKDSAGRTSIIE